MVKDRWIRAAMSDDKLVVDLLVRLKQSQASSPLKSSYPSSATPMLPLEWSLRLPRSRAVRCDAVSQRMMISDSARCSPATPLSWSGGASPSDTADGFEESSHSRSKTFAELEDEESSLLKERTDIKKELATLRASFTKQRAKNVSLKRIKLDLNFHSSTSLDASSCGPEMNQLHQTTLSTIKEFSSNLGTQITYDDCPQPNSSEASELRHGFMLPDLNMMPSGVDYGSETLCEMR